MINADDKAWLEETVGKVTPRPCVAEFFLEGVDQFGNNMPTRYRITIKGILDSTPMIEPARIELRDEEYVMQRIKSVLPAGDP